MSGFEPIVAFTTYPVSVAARVSSFHGVSCYVGEPRNAWRTGHLKRVSRARIYALGAAPPPPSSKGPDEDNDSSEETPDPASRSEKGEGSKQSGGADVPASSEEVTAEDILNSPTFLKRKLEIVQKELIEAKSKVDKADEAVAEEKQNYVRLAADFENYRRRSLEDLRQQDTKSTAKVCKELLSVLDNFERATSAVEPASEREKTIVKSYEAINRQLLDALIKLKVEPVDAVGEVFDPEVHEAIQRLESNEYNEDVVCQQYSRGYKIGSTLIRAAIVGVSVGPGPEDGAAAGNGDSDAAEVAEGGTGSAAPAVEGL